MSTETLLYILIGSQAGLLALLLKHMFSCRDTRLDIERIKLKVGLEDE